MKQKAQGNQPSKRLIYLFITIKKDYFHLINGTTDNQNIPNKNQIQTYFQGTILIS